MTLPHPSALVGQRCRLARTVMSSSPGPPHGREPRRDQSRDLRMTSGSERWWRAIGVQPVHLRRGGRTAWVDVLVERLRRSPARAGWRGPGRGGSPRARPLPAASGRWAGSCAWLRRSRAPVIGSVTIRRHTDPCDGDLPGLGGGDEPASEDLPDPVRKMVLPRPAGAAEASATYSVDQLSLVASLAERRLCGAADQERVWS